VIQKPVERSRLVSSVGKALRRAAAQSHLREVRKRIRGELVGCSDAIESLLAQIAKVGPTAARVLICGESGTGKELVARAIHHASELSHQPFVRVNCAAIPRELIESELFGHERGAFTGAVGQKKGLFEAADGGTIFLDEIGDMALGVQAKVLRVLQSGEFMRVGGDRLVKVNVRVLAATHRDLRRAVELGSFREDLYFRLAVVPVTVPPLRDRKEDIELLTHHFIELACSQNRMPVKLITEGVLEALRRHDWPGNVRELRNVVERMVILSEGELTPQDIPVEISTVREPIAVPSLVVAEPPLDVSLRDYRDAVERELILRRLHALSWNVSRTAVSLGIERTYLHRKMKNLKIFR
jgi:DNA-binding NtrC family response regulator